MITIPETRNSLDPGHPGAKYTMPMWIQIGWVRMVRGPEEKGQRVGGSCGFLGQRSSSKEINFH